MVRHHLLCDQRRIGQPRRHAKGGEALFIDVLRHVGEHVCEDAAEHIVMSIGRGLLGGALRVELEQVRDAAVPFLVVRRHQRVRERQRLCDRTNVRLTAELAHHDPRFDGGLRIWKVFAEKQRANAVPTVGFAHRVLRHLRLVRHGTVLVYEDRRVKGVVALALEREHDGVGERVRERFAPVRRGEGIVRDRDPPVSLGDDQPPQVRRHLGRKSDGLSSEQDGARGERRGASAEAFRRERTFERGDNVCNVRANVRRLEHGGDSRVGYMTLYRRPTQGSFSRRVRVLRFVRLLSSHGSLLRPGFRSTQGVRVAA
jgi:hypothetical protein